MLFPSFFNAGAPTYEIEQSLRFDGSSYLSRTVSGFPTTQGGISFWVKPCRPSTVFGEDPIFNVNSSFSLSRNNITRWYYRPNSSGGGDTSWDSRTSNDTAAWYHVFLKFNSSNSTSLYLNGVLVGTQNYAITPQNGTLYIGRDSGGSYYANYYLAEYHAAFGGSLNATDFGEFDNNGVWRPIKFTGSYGSDGFYLKFDPSAANGIGHDHSGNGNNLTPSGFTTSGTGTDVMSDTPTNNYCTLNPLAVTVSTGTMSDGNLVGTTTVSNGGNMFGTFVLPSSGKWYWEVKIDSNNGGIIGIGEYDPTEDRAWQLPNSVFIYDYPGQGQKIVDGTASTYGSEVDVGDLIGVACDADADTIEFYINGTAQGSISHTIGGLSPCLCDGSGSAAACTFTVNFGQRAFEQTVPTGYKALNTSNLPAPTVKDGSDYFTTLAYSGTGSTDSKVIEDSQGNDWAPDFVWLKKRNSGANHMLYDRVRGASESLRTNTTGAEVTGATNGDLTAFTSTGFTLDSGGDVNGSGNTYVAWNWLAGGSGSSNTDGSITSTVSANPSAGFSIVSYTGNGTSGATVGHGLGVAPSMIIIKNRDNSAGRWIVYHGVLGGTKYIRLDSNTVSVTDSSIFNDTDPSSTTFTLGTNYYVNGDTENIIAYCFAEVEGYSKFGSYTGTNSTDGPFVHTGFSVSWLMVKKDGSNTDWKIYDAKRDPYNVVSTRLAANTTSADLSGNAQDIDFVSNGFKFRGTNGDQNSGGTFYYAAFGSSPFGGSGVSPATAR